MQLHLCCVMLELLSRSATKRPHVLSCCSLPSQTQVPDELIKDFKTAREFAFTVLKKADCETVEDVVETRGEHRDALLAIDPSSPFSGGADYRLYNLLTCIYTIIYKVPNYQVIN